jgi:hypothetical protein
MQTQSSQTSPKLLRSFFDNLDNNMSADSHSEDETIRTKTVAVIQMNDFDESKNKIKETFTIRNKSKRLDGVTYTQISEYKTDLNAIDKPIVKINESFLLDSEEKTSGSVLESIEPFIESAISLELNEINNSSDESTKTDGLSENSNNQNKESKESETDESISYARSLVDTTEDRIETKPEALLEVDKSSNDKIENFKNQKDDNIVTLSIIDSLDIENSNKEAQEPILHVNNDKNGQKDSKSVNSLIIDDKPIIEIEDLLEINNHTILNEEIQKIDIKTDDNSINQQLQPQNTLDNPINELKESLDIQNKDANETKINYLLESSEINNNLNDEIVTLEDEKKEPSDERVKDLDNNISKTDASMLENSNLTVNNKIEDSKNQNQDNNYSNNETQESIIDSNDKKEDQKDRNPISLLIIVDKPIVEINPVIKNESTTETKNSLEPLDESSNSQNKRNIERKEPETEDTLIENNLPKTDALMLEKSTVKAGDKIKESENENIFDSNKEPIIDNKNEIKEGQKDIIGDKPIIEINPIFKNESTETKNSDENSNNQMFNQNEVNIESNDPETENKIEIKPDTLLEIIHLNTGKVDKSSNNQNEIKGDHEDKPIIETNPVVKNETENFLEINNSDTVKLDESLNERVEPLDEVSSNDPDESTDLNEKNEPEIAIKTKILSFSTIELTQITDKITQIYEYPFDFYNNADNFNKTLSKSSIIYNSKY